MPQAGLIAYTREVAAATDLPVIVYNRNNARYTEESAVEVSKIPNVVGFKDGTGDLDQVARIVRAVTDACTEQGLPVLQRPADRGDLAAGLSRDRCAAVLVGHVRLRPRTGARVLQRAGDAVTTHLANALLREFFHPLVRLRDTVPGYAVSLDQGRRRDGGHPAGPVRAPLIMPTADDLAELRSIIAAGRAVLAEALHRGRVAMAPSRIRITGARITPVAFVDPPLLNTVGVHQPYALRAIIQLDTDAGLVGLGETYADQAHWRGCDAAAEAITGLDVFALNVIRAAIADRLSGDSDSRAVGHWPA